MPSLPAVWLVDDDDDDRFLLSQALKELRVRVLLKELSDGEQVLPALKEATALPHLMLLDLNMPRLNGFDVLAQLRTMARYRDLPIIILTTSASKEDEARSLALGASEFLTKPASLPALVRLLKRLLTSWPLT